MRTGRTNAQTESPPEAAPDPTFGLYATSVQILATRRLSATDSPAPCLSGGFPAITHVDGSCRVQLVAHDNPVYRDLLTAFYALTGCPVLLNTSLNLAGIPIAAFPENARELFHDSRIDAMVVGDTFYQR